MKIQVSYLPLVAALLTILAVAAAAKAFVGRRNVPLFEAIPARIEIPAMTPDKPYLASVKLQNNSGQAVRIMRVIATCGCTEPRVEKQTIGPRESTVMRVAATAKPGMESLRGSVDVGYVRGEEQELRWRRIPIRGSIDPTSVPKNARNDPSPEHFLPQVTQRSEQ